MANKRLKSGVELTDELLDELVREAEAGYDPKDLTLVPVRGRPSLNGGPGQAKTIQVRVEHDLAEAVWNEAMKQDISLSEYVRSVLRKHVPTG